MTSDAASKLAYQAAIRNYLVQLTELVGRQVAADELSTIDEVEKVRNRSRTIADEPSTQFTIAPDALKSSRFQAFVADLQKSNAQPVYIWLDATNSCGAFTLPKISHFNFAFNQSVIPEGVIVFLPTDLKDKMLLDFSPEEVEIELHGKRWSAVRY